MVTPADVAACVFNDLEGEFLRHTSPKVSDLGGSRFGGRWGPPREFSVLYLGRPSASVVAEAYRHLVDPVVGMTGRMVGPRKLWVCDVNVTQLLDLRDPESRARLGLSETDLSSEVRDYRKCNEIAIAAHQLELHGIVAPSASRLGETLALFDQHLPIEEIPLVREVEIWDALPSDPRRLRLVADERSRTEKTEG